MPRRINGGVRSGVTSGCQREENGQKWMLEEGKRAGGTEADAETAVDSIIPALPCNFDRWHDINGSPETAPRSQLTEQGASTLNSLHPHTPSSRLSSEPLHDSISTEGSRRARFEATTSFEPASTPC